MKNLIKLTIVGTTALGCGVFIGVKGYKALLLKATRNKELMREIIIEVIGEENIEQIADIIGEENLKKIINILDKCRKKRREEAHGK